MKLQNRRGVTGELKGSVVTRKNHTTQCHKILIFFANHHGYSELVALSVLQYSCMCAQCAGTPSPALFLSPAGGYTTDSG